VGLEPESARAIFLAIAKFFAKQPAAKNEKNYFIQRDEVSDIWGFYY